MNQFAFIIVLLSVKRINMVNFIVYRSHYAEARCDVHLNANAWRHKQTETLLFF